MTCRGGPAPSNPLQHALMIVDYLLLAGVLLLLLGSFPFFIFFLVYLLKSHFIYIISTCVGFGTGTRDLPRGFSWKHGIRDSPAYSQLDSCLRLRGSGFTWSHPYALTPGRPSPGIP